MVYYLSSMNDYMEKNYNKREFVKQVFNNVATKYDLMNDLMSFGTHRYWKRDLINWLYPERNTRLLDAACGTGDIAKIYLERIKNNGNVICLDNNIKMINEGKKKFKKVKNIRWVKANTEKLPFKNDTFDYYTISFGIRNVSNINKSLKEAFRVLKCGGRFMCLEFSKIENQHFNKIYQNYSKFLPGLGKLITGSEKSYNYLVDSINQFHSQAELVEIIKKNGFDLVKYRNLSGGIAAIHSGWKI